MLRTLQACRAFAALAVVAFHLSLVMGARNFYGVATFAAFTWRGDLGVDFFFVLSGFIILRAHAKDIGHPERLGRYAWRRVTRLYPTYWVLTAGLLVLTVLHVTSGDRPPATPAGWVTDLSLIRFSAIQPPIHPAWTLFHEIAFYALFGLLLLSRRLGIAVMGLWLAANLVHLQYPAVHDRTPLNVYLCGFNLNFFIGMGAYALYRTGRVHILWAPVGLAIVLAAILLQAHGVPVPPLLYAAALGLVICASAVQEERGRLPVPQVLVFLGNASYVIYLTHEAVMSRVLELLIKLRAERFLHLEGVFVLAFVLTIALGSLAYIAIEKPLLWTLRRMEKRPHPAQPVAA